MREKGKPGTEVPVQRFLEGSPTNYPIPMHRSPLWTAGMPLSMAVRVNSVW